MANRQCPACSSQKVHRSHRRGILERFVLALIGVRPYRCFACNQRFFGLQQASDQPAPPESPAAGVRPATEPRKSRKQPGPKPPQGVSAIIFRNRCAYCGSRRVPPSAPRTPIERMLIVLLSRPYRCEDCNARLFGPYLQFGRRVMGSRDE